mmetsp:Transcript_816/g.1923  ORF Transcript_816/g.1923 Transcript_816/m.1923 type:complete len:231 (+) Transcript_816:104-796(+)
MMRLSMWPCFLAMLSLYGHLCTPSLRQTRFITVAQMPRRLQACLCGMSKSCSRTCRVILMAGRFRPSLSWPCFLLGKIVTSVSPSTSSSCEFESSTSVSTSSCEGDCCVGCGTALKLRFASASSEDSESAAWWRTSIHDIGLGFSTGWLGHNKSTTEDIPLKPKGDDDVALVSVGRRRPGNSGANAFGALPQAKRTRSNLGNCRPVFIGLQSGVVEFRTPGRDICESRLS